MDEDSLKSRISRISTVWTMLADAHQAPDTEAGAARLAFIRRYQGAVYRYLLGATRDPDAADELFQEFALRFVRGAFRGADPKRGRFRDYLKSTLYHLVVDYQKRERKRPRSLDGDIVQPVAQSCETTMADQQFLQSFRDELLARAWSALAETEHEGSQPYYSVLKFRAENSNATSAEMARQLTNAICPNRAFTETGIRKTLQRAREQFANLLIDDVAHSMGCPTAEELEQELIDLDLLPYCKPALDRRSARKQL